MKMKVEHSNVQVRQRHSTRENLNQQKLSSPFHSLPKPIKCEQINIVKNYQGRSINDFSKRSLIKNGHGIKY